MHCKKAGEGEMKFNLANIGNSFKGKRKKEGEWRGWGDKEAEGSGGIETRI